MVDINPDIQRKIELMANLSKKVDATISPLKQAFGINFFWYNQFKWGLGDIDTFWLGNRQDWIDHYYSHKFYLCFNNLPDIQSSRIYFSDDYIESNPKTNELAHMFNVMREQFDISHIVMVARHYPEYSEFFSFGVPHGLHHFNRTFLLNKKYFKKFIIYFKDKARLLIETSKIHSYSLKDMMGIRSVENFYVAANKQSENLNFMENLTPQRYFLESKYEGVYLTPREMECLKLLCIEVSFYSEIGSRLNISGATVREYIDKIKKKLGCHSKKHLIETVKRDGILDMINDYLPSDDFN